MIKNKFTKGKIYTSLSLSLLLALSAPAISRAATEDAVSPDKSMFYIKLINYTIPFVKSIAVSEDDLAEYDFSIKNKLLQLIGLNLANPLSVVGKEISFLKPVDTQVASTEGKTSFFINPFKLNDSNIIKNPEQTNNTPVDTPTNINTAQVYNPKLKKPLNPAKPEVLIYHTHTTESFRPNETVKDSDFAINVMDENKNIVSVGDVITKDLEEKYGIAVIHDKTVHNTIFTESYARSGKTLDTYLNKYKDFKLIIDLHRDSISDKAVMTTKMNDNKLAKYMFVIGPGNKTKDKNIEVSKKLSSISQTLFPGLIRAGNGADYGIYYHRAGTKFNQQKSGNAVLIEMGSYSNTLDEAKTTGIYLSRIIAEYINGKK